MRIETVQMIMLGAGALVAGGGGAALACAVADAVRHVLPLLTGAA